ncbi:MAG: LytTR family DNA-binding domain-containing protein, partial [Sphingomicrobium sp.]
AAGNYVQVHAGGRTTLHRVTMREVEASLDPAAFARIHRSAIVHISSIEGRVLIGGSAAVRLRDGTLIKIGSRYARKFDAMAV